MGWVNPAGGLTYHWRAMRGQHLWRDYRGQIGQFLRDWNPPQTKLLLVGPSAGYSLPRTWLGSFPSLVGLEVDPLAKRLFASRHHVHPHWLATPWTPDLAGIEAALRQYEDAAVLFCNFLGQLPALYPDLNLEATHKRLRELLRGRSWASYHDRLSGQAVLPFVSAHYSIAPPNAELASDFELTGTWMDHETHTFSAGLPVEVFPWQLTQETCHLIEAVSQVA